MGPWNPCSVTLLLLVCVLKGRASGTDWGCGKENSGLSPDPGIILLELAKSLTQLGEHIAFSLTASPLLGLHEHKHLTQPADLTAKHG